MKKLIGSKLFVFFIGFLLGMSLWGLYSFIIVKNADNVYFKLKNDYCIENIGYLKGSSDKCVVNS